MIKYFKKGIPSGSGKSPAESEDIKMSYFDKFDAVIEKYMPRMGEGETQASQIVTAVNKLIYKWYNDGDVYDNTYGLDGWCNDLSSYANWLYKHCPETKDILEQIFVAGTDDDYEVILKQLADATLTEVYLTEKNALEKIGSIYKCEGIFKFVEDNDDEEEWY